jgi:hypothetical protein
MINSLACLALIAAAAGGTAADATDRLSFRQLESAQPRDPLTGNFVVYTEVHHSPAEQVAPALATLREAIPAGMSRAEAERILAAAGARCAAPSEGAQSCKYSGIETVDEYLDEVKWHVRLALADDRVTSLDVARNWRRH